MPNAPTRKLLANAALWKAGADASAHVREVPPGSNRGPRVDQILQTAGVPLGNPWCCAAAYTWYDEGAKALGIPNPLPRTGYCPAMADWGAQRGRVVAAAHAAPGDVLLYWHALLGRFAHAGLCQQNRGDGTLVAIEGNTNTDGSREGNGVYVKVRSVAGTRHIAIRMQDYGVDV